MDGNEIKRVKNSLKALGFHNRMIHGYLRSLLISLIIFIVSGYMGCIFFLFVLL